MFKDFLNDAMTTASSIMNPVWNGYSQDAFNLSNIACQLIDRCRVYNINNVTVLNESDIIRSKLKAIAEYAPRLLKNADVQQFINRWTEKTLTEEEHETVMSNL